MSLEREVSKLVKDALASNPAVLEGIVFGSGNVEATQEMLSALEEARLAVLVAVFTGLQRVAEEVDRLRSELELPPV